MAKVIPVLVFATLITACNGGGDSSTTPVTPTPVVTAEGFWSGVSTTGFDVDLAILENGETWGVYSIGNTIYGAVQGATSSSGTTLNGSGKDFDLSAGTVTPGTYSGTFAAKTSINMTFSRGGGLNGTYQPFYDQPASLTSLSGTFTGSGASGNTSSSSVSVGISSLGVVSATDSGCSIAGTVIPRASGKNIFNVSVTFTGTTCALGNGSTANGVAYYDSTTRQLLVLALNNAKTDGFIYIGTKP